MAALTNAQVRKMWDQIFQLGQGKEQLKAGGLPSRAARNATFQAIENFWEANRATLKAQMDLAAGRTLTVPEARAYARAWLSFKLGVE